MKIIREIFLGIFFILLLPLAFLAVIGEWVEEEWRYGRRNRVKDK
jgi:hypothetical protein